MPEDKSREPVIKKIMGHDREKQRPMPEEREANKYARRKPKDTKEVIDLITGARFPKMRTK